MGLNTPWDNTVEPSTGYSVPYRIPEGYMRKTTTYYQEMSHGQTIKPP